MKKCIILGILAAFLWFIWCCCVVASDADDQMEEMMTAKNECCTEVMDEHERN